MNTETLELRDHLATLRERKWTVITLLVLTVAISLYFSFMRTPVYSSTAEVVVRAARFDPTQPSSATGFINMGTEERIANSATVADIAHRQLDDRGVEPAEVSASRSEEAETIVFTARAPTPKAAQASAGAFAEAYLEQRREQVVGELRDARLPYLRRIEKIDRMVQEIARATVGAETGERAVLAAQHASLLTERASLYQRLGDFPPGSNINIGDVVLGPQLPSEPSEPNHPRTAALAIVAGLVIGIGAAFVRDRLDDRVRDRSDLEVHSGAPVLSFVPRLPKSHMRSLALPVSGSDGGEAYRALAARLLHAASLGRVQHVLVTSSLSGEGKTVTTVHLAAALAATGRSVVVVSTDLRRPTLHRYLGGDPDAGLSEVLTGRLVLMKAIVPTRLQNVYVLHAGPRLADHEPQELLNSDAMRATLDELRQTADFVLFDAPPVLSAPDVITLGPLMDGVLFVVDPEIAHRPVVEQARRELEMIGVSVVGVVVNKYIPRSFKAYGAGYGYNDRNGPVARPADDASKPARLG